MEVDYRSLDKYVTSLTHINGRMRPKYVRHVEISTDSQQTEVQRLAAAWLPKGFVEMPRFEMPVDVHTFASLTPVQYLTNYCIVSSRVKKLLYHRHYAKYREPKVDGIDSLEKLRKGVKDVCTFSINTNSYSPSESSLNYFLHGVLGFELEDSIRINFKTFMGIAALAERIFNPNYMESWWENEKRLESDYLVYKTLREQEVELKNREEEREKEQVYRQSLKRAEFELKAMATLRRFSVKNSADDADAEFPQMETPVILEASSSEKVLVAQVEEKRNKLENKISITQILEIESRPNKSPKELMEKVDFHGLQWKLKGVDISPGMRRLLRIIVNL